MVSKAPAAVEAVAAAAHPGPLTGQLCELGGGNHRCM
jgi:hypothetical protein